MTIANAVTETVPASKASVPYSGRTSDDGCHRAL